MQKFLVADGGNPDGTAKDAITGVQTGTKYLSKYYNDNMFNLFEFLEGEGYQLIADDLTQLKKAFRGAYDNDATYNTSSVATQSINDIVLGSNGMYYECQADATSGDNPVGSTTGNWKVKNFAYIARREQSVTLDITVDADYTLTDDENSYGIIDIPIGTLTTQRNIIVSDFERYILVENNSGFTQTIKTAAGTGVDVKNGETRYLRSNGTNVIETIPSAGLVLQKKQVLPSVLSGTTNIPDDGTTPLVTEGTEFLSQAITPSSTANKIEISGSVQVARNTAGTYIKVAIFRGSTCVGVVQQTNGSAGGDIISINLEDSPATTSPITYSARIGISAGTWYVGQLNTGGFNGEEAKSGFSIKEIKG